MRNMRRKLYGSAIIAVSAYILSEMYRSHVYENANQNSRRLSDVLRSVFDDDSRSEKSPEEHVRREVDAGHGVDENIGRSCQAAELVRGVHLRGIRKEPRCRLLRGMRREAVRELQRRPQEAEGQSVTQAH